MAAMPVCLYYFGQLVSLGEQSWNLEFETTAHLFTLLYDFNVLLSKFIIYRIW